MAALKGSEKQVAWAMAIMAEKIEDMKAWVEEGVQAGDYSAEEAKELIDKLVEIAQGQTSAGWWIDRRGYGTEGFIDSMLMAARVGQGRDKPFEHGLYF